jgi:hypothetical protein
LEVAKAQDFGTPATELAFFINKKFVLSKKYIDWYYSYWDNVESSTGS